MTFYLGIYFAFGVAYIIATFFRSTIFFNIALIAVYSFNPYADV